MKHETSDVDTEAGAASEAAASPVLSLPRRVDTKQYQSETVKPFIQTGSKS